RCQLRQQLRGSGRAARNTYFNDCPVGIIRNSNALPVSVELLERASELRDVGFTNRQSISIVVHELDELVDTPDGHQPTSIENGYAITELESFFRVVRGKQNGALLTARDFLTQEATESSCRDRIETAGGLVEQQHTR